MTKENPYPDKRGFCVSHGAWDEGYHSRDEIVNELVEACQHAEQDYARFDRGIVSTISMGEIRRAIAKAKEE